MRDDINVIGVLGTGPSIQKYRQGDCNETIGVNNIFEYASVDRLLLLDPPGSFEPVRRESIENSNPKYTYSTLDDWRFMPNFCKISVVDPSRGGQVDTLDDWNKLPMHVDSTFTAVCMAYHFAASDIVMYGVDFIDHHLEHYADPIIESYRKLHAALMQRGALLWLGSDSGILKDYIPKWPESITELL